MPTASGLFGFLQLLPRIALGSEDPDLASLARELREGLELYYHTAEAVLAGTGIRLRLPAEKDLALERHFFSALFLYSFYRGGVPGGRRVLYAAVNQCLRGMVTGCDNLMDDEYKKTLDTDLPPEGTRFRSVLDIMVSDRVLVELLSQDVEQGNTDLSGLRRACAASLGALAPSGAQEASEECGVFEVLPPDVVLTEIHHFKTGLLFQCVWAVPEILGDGAAAQVPSLRQGLYRIGMGCQVLDDLVDLRTDLRTHRHNYLASLIRHESPPGSWDRLMRFVGDAGSADPRLDAFPEARRTAARTAQQFLRTGLEQVLAPQHRAYLVPAMKFLSHRIGATDILEAAAAEDR